MQKRKPLAGKTSSSWQGGLDLVQNELQHICKRQLIFAKFIAN